jgi:hypothetical protein
MDAGDWAAWAQAFGAIAAIAVTQRIASRESRLAAISRLQNDAAFLAIAEGIADLAEGLLETADEQLRTGIQASDESFAQTLTAISKMPLERFPSAKSALAFVELGRMVEFYGRSLKTAVLELRHLKKVSNDSFVILDEFRQAANQCVVAIRTEARDADQRANARGNSHQKGITSSNGN